jgi:hypothetical protein
MPKRGPIGHHSGPAGPLGRPLSPVGGPLALCHLVLLPMIYTIDSKVVLGQLIQWWSRDLTRIDEVAIPCLLLHLDSLIATPPQFLACYSTSAYIY